MYFQSPYIHLSLYIYACRWVCVFMYVPVCTCTGTGTHTHTHTQGSVYKKSLTQSRSPVLYSEKVTLSEASYEQLNGPQGHWTVLVYLGEMDIKTGNVTWMPLLGSGRRYEDKIRKKKRVSQPQSWTSTQLALPAPHVDSQKVRKGRSQDR